MVFISYLRDYFKSRIIKNSIYNLSGLFGQSLIMLICIPILVKRMGVEQYGLWMIASSFLGAMGIFNMGLGASVVKYVAEYSYKKDSHGLSSVVYGTIIFYFTIALLLSIPLYYVSPSIVLFLKMSKSLSTVANSAIRIMVLGFLPMLLLNIGTSVPMGLQRYEIANIINFSKTAFTQIFAVIIVILGGEVFGVLIGTLVVLWVCSLISLIVAFRMLIPYRLRFFFSWAYGRKLFSFSAAVFLQNLGSQIFSSVDRFCVGSVLGMDAVTYYSVGTSVAAKLLQVVSSLSQSLMPPASEAAAMNDYKRLYNLFIKGLGITTVISLLLGMIMLIFSRIFLQLWMGSEFMNHSLSMFKILILGYAIFSIVAPAYFMANGMGMPWICSIGTISGGILTISLIFILGSIWDLNGVAWANWGYIINFIIVIYLFWKLRYGLKEASY